MYTEGISFAINYFASLCVVTTISNRDAIGEVERESICGYAIA